MGKKVKTDGPTFLVRARKWAASRGLFGNQAFIRYVMLCYLEALSKVSKDFIFKGGNLLWVYIGTPRGTVDLDLSTLSLNTHSEVKKSLKDACKVDTDGISFSVKTFQEMDSSDGLAASVTIEFKTDQGASNTFEIDVVYDVKTDFDEILSPVDGRLRIKAATIENIIVDKVQAANRFAAGNTRMKDFDDLWRLSHRKTKFIKPIVIKMLKERNLPRKLDLSWINPEMQRSWQKHQKRYPDLPENLSVVFTTINRWLMSSKDSG